MEHLLQLFIIRYHDNTFTKTSRRRDFYKKFHLGKIYTLNDLVKILDIIAASLHKLINIY